MFVSLHNRNYGLMSSTATPTPVPAPSRAKNGFAYCFQAALPLLNSSAVSSASSSARLSDALSASCRVERQ
jgi:hypothetical protein